MDSRLWTLALFLLLTTGDWAVSQPAKKPAKSSVVLNDAKAYKGYTLIAPQNAKTTYLIDMEGRVVHTWQHDSTPALVPYLLDNGNLLRPGTVNRGVAAPGFGGRLQEYTWDGELVWDWTFDRKNQHPHHDITRLPNGNVLMIMADRKGPGELLAAGRRSEAIRDVLNVDGIIEVKKTGPKSAEIVWEWHVFDHLVQEHDKSLKGFAKVAETPQRLNINHGGGMFGGKKIKKEDLDKLKGLGYLGGPDAKPLPANQWADWTHFNSVAYNADLDQIMISVHSFNEIWIIDHSTTTAEAKTSKGGKYGKGGDLLYRWGNPQAYRSGTNADQKLFGQHNAHWIPRGLPGEGNVLIFNNGMGRPDGQYSSIEEIILPMNKDGTYESKQGQPFVPARIAWSYSAAPKKNAFYSMVISGAHRLPNGDTLICSGTSATVFEVTPQKEVVWKFVNPAMSFGMMGMPGGAAGGVPGGLFRSYRYGDDHPAFKGRKLTPGKKIEDL